MPINRNTIVRYKTIDRMLRGGRMATLDEIIDACQDAIDRTIGFGSVSRRTIQHDIQEMRYSEALGYYAPIVVKDKKFYTYEDRHYSISKLRFSDEDMRQLSEAMDILKQMSGFAAFQDVEDVVNRLEDYVASMRYKREPVILLEKNDRLRGLELITPIHEAITSRTALKVLYKPFRSTEPMSLVVSPYILKEFRNRWFLFGRKKQTEGVPSDQLLTNLALDRIVELEVCNEPYEKDSEFHPDEFFRDMIGVSRANDAKVETVRFMVDADQAPYIRTKPLHSSQKEVWQNEDGSVVFEISVIQNFELQRDILGYGEHITVLSPQSLVDAIKARYIKCVDNYKE